MGGFSHGRVSLSTSYQDNYHEKESSHMSDHKLLRAILIILTLIGLGVAVRALWGEDLKKYMS
jgi:hypothetical protein